MPDETLEMPLARQPAPDRSLRRSLGLARVDIGSAGSVGQVDMLTCAMPSFSDDMDYQACSVAMKHSARSVLKMPSQDSILACARQGGNAMCWLGVCSTLVLRCAWCLQALEGRFFLGKKGIARSLACRMSRASRLSRSELVWPLPGRAVSASFGHRPTVQANLSLPAFGVIIPPRRGRSVMKRAALLYAIVSIQVRVNAKRCAMK